MRIDDIDIYNLPLWLNGIFEEVERICYETLKEESEFYRNVLAEAHELLEKYRFTSTIADGDKIEESLSLSVEEAKALSRFWALETDHKTMEAVQLYLLGGKHIWELLELLKLKMDIS